MKNDVDKMSRCKDVEKNIDDGNNNQSKTKGTWPDRDYLCHTGNELQFVEDSFYTTNKKRAFTLGAIDGIGDIGLLKAPLMNPKCAEVEPPILHLPSKTNLLKNVHVKVEQETNIDRSYKYRAQNSNLDIINNIKPLYSLPEKVFTYYKKPKNKEREKDAAAAQTSDQCSNEDAKQGVEKEQSEEKEREDESETDSEKDSENESDTKKETKKESETKHFIKNKSDETLKYTKMGARPTDQKNVHFKNTDDLQTHLKSTCEVLFDELKTKEKTNNKTKAQIKCVTENELLQPALKLSRQENQGQSTKLITDSVLTTENDKRETADNTDEFENLKSNKIMSSTLTNALRFLAGDIC